MPAPRARELLGWTLPCSPRGRHQAPVGPGASSSFRAGSVPTCVVAVACLAPRGRPGWGTPRPQLPKQMPEAGDTVLGEAVPQPTARLQTSLPPAGHGV